MSNIAVLEPQSVLADMANHYRMDKRAFESTLKTTIMPANTSNEHIATFLLVARQYNLNPFTKEIFAFPSRGGIVPIVSIDGWLKMINENPDFDGMDFKDTLDDKGKLISVTCRMHRKSRSHPIEVTEYMSECLRMTDVWKNWPARMLRHKATIQAARYAFGFAGIYEPDEAERMNEVQTVQAIEAKLEIADERKQRHDDAADQFAESIQLIKSEIARHDEHGDPDALYTVAETWSGIPSAAQIDLWLAPSKGGIFTTHERDVIKTKLPKEPQA